MKYYVYIYLNPLKSGEFIYSKKLNFNYEPFYVGMGSNRRIDDHIKNALKNKGFRNLRDNIILKILRSGIEPIRYKLYENITYYSALRLEKCLIKIIGRRNKNKGTLSNLTDGGEGAFGIIYTEEQKDKRKGENNSFYNKHHTEKTKDKIRKTIGDSRKGSLNPNFNNKWTDDMKIESSKRQKDNHKHLTGENNPSKNEKVRNKLSEIKFGINNPNAKKWLLISPDNNEIIIEGGIKRNLKSFGLSYQQFIKMDGVRKNKKGWTLKEI